MGTLQQNLILCLEECCERPFTEKEQQLTSILTLLAMEPFASRACPQRVARKRRERRAIARAFVCKAVYNHPTTRATI
jgi:hypothetical protein